MGDSFSLFVFPIKIIVIKAARKANIYEANMYSTLELNNYLFYFMFVYSLHVHSWGHILEPILSNKVSILKISLDCYDSTASGIALQVFFLLGTSLKNEIFLKF